MVASQAVQTERSVTKRLITCKGDAVPLVKLSLTKKVCLRKNGEKLDSSESVERFMQQHFSCQAQEHFYGLYLSARNEVLAVQEVSVGGLTSTQVDPRVLFAGAIESGAAAIIIVHNHPSGNPEPSDADIQLTKVLVDGATLLGLQILDHVILGRGGRAYSFLSNGRMPQRPRSLMGDVPFKYAPENETKPRK